MKTIELTVIEAAQLADMLEALCGGFETEHEESIAKENARAMAMEIMNRVHNRQAINYNNSNKFASI